MQTEMQLQIILLKLYNLCIVKINEIHIESAVLWIGFLKYIREIEDVSIYVVPNE